ncbi:multisubunit sodium/proton antiporter, MrpB subunit [Dethiosulfatibacter aminovorans DSM 17477]|uniref:Multisubunit sodium/proton antiporter, MrpB subunit n=1 Tax=Dethiosulfatibacter aminovorans DSM 17477 TaxID=1121476 RepID=A0A1M6GSC0_9FIRM|nr:MnhB domain-containing protein [Dethiosulfatibacter aminovorans]SHJ12885.1 multisubunit sodium/proton antiporter, MrpB subunit [Dethiosulfatibacter aminovorans DSM 17477]
MNNHSELLSRSLGVLYPFILITGIYVTVNGHLSPGGGFQGGAVLAAIFIIKHLVLPIHDTRLERIQMVEKLALIFILLFPVAFIFSKLNISFPGFNSIYLVGMNILISLKVACGLSLIFFRFVYYETK